jgi:hypothetical protein
MQTPILSSSLRNEPISPDSCSFENQHTTSSPEEHKNLKISLRKEKIFNINKITKEYCLNSEFLQSFIEKPKLVSTDNCTTENSNTQDVSKKSGIKENFNFDGLLNALINIKHSNTVSAFHLNFLEFKKVLNFKRAQRKTKIDSILKKCKSKFFRAVQESIKKLIQDTNNNISRLPQSFITNINIEYNKQFMNKSILQIYLDLNVIQNYNDFFYYSDQKQAMLLNRFLSLTYSELFNHYIASQRFKEDCDCIREKEGEKFEILYKYVSKIFIHYYSLSKGNRQKFKHNDMNINNDSCMNYVNSM